MRKVIKAILITILLTSKLLQAQEKTITQPLEPPPYMEIMEWLAHEGDLDMNEVIADNPAIWHKEKLNIPYWEKNGIKWFKQEVIIPDVFEGLDVILKIDVDPSAIVFVIVKDTRRRI